MRSRGKVASLQAIPLYVSSPIPGPGSKHGWAVGFEDFQSVDAEGGFELTVLSMKVGRRVVIEKHSYQNSIERTDRRHSRS